MKIKASQGKHAKHASDATEEAPESSLIADSPQTEEMPKVVETASVEADPSFQQTAYMPAVAAEGAGAYAAPNFEAGFEPSFDMTKNKAAKKRRRKKALVVTGIFVGSLVLLAAAVYVAGSVFFMDHFYPKTTLGTYDVSLKSSAEAQEILADGLDDYQIAVNGQGLSFVLSAKDAGVSMDGETVVKNAHASVNPWKWPLELMSSHDVSDSLVASSNGGGVDETVKAIVDEFNATATQPVNATIAYNDTSKAFEIVPEQLGTALAPDLVTGTIDEAIKNFNTSVTITEEDLSMPLISQDNLDLKNACSTANQMIAADLTLNMGGATVVEVGPDVISDWVVLGGDLAVTFNEDALTAWIDGVAAQCNTIETERTYTRPDGKVITVSGGDYGWEIDNEALRAMVKDGVAAGQVATLDIPVTQSGNGFVALGGQDWGPRYVDIDLSEQHVRFYDNDGSIIWESDCISGKPDGEHDTPTGVYMVNRKASPSKLMGYENGKKIYETEVTFWMPFVGNTIGLHDATWQPDFGGSMYAEGYGSHGCVNLPYSKAQELYGILEEGDTVVCHW